ncbi:hypothetical protein [Nocardia asiatica]|uniref:hypothetical protein n=1 Tax=Nocardia asiatica TaxID=209252 RepID=UPI0024581AC3|nr:hypothetical protein [Nocardia asiatica]
MSSEDYKRAAALVLAKCATKDLWFPNVGETTILGWAEVFAESGLTTDELLDGVERAYNKAEEGYRPLPASIVNHARAAYFDALRELPEERRKLMDQANYVLQDMGFSPPVAHRWARRVALGRTPNVALSEEQQAEFRRRLAERQEIENLPRRQIDPGKFGRPADDPGEAAAS